MVQPEPPDEDPVEQLRRWEAFGGVWEVVHRDRRSVTVSLRRCDGGEEAGRLTSDDPDLRTFLAGAGGPEGAAPRSRP